MHVRAGGSRARERTRRQAQVREPSEALADDNARHLPVRAVIFDFNGTLSHDEPILCEIFCDLFAEYGRPLSAQEYFDELVGLSDPEIVRAWLGRDHPSVDEVIERRIERYKELVADGSSVPFPVREAVRYASERVPVAVVSGAAREEIEPVIAAAGLTARISTIVGAEDVANGKPDPAGYLRALALLHGGLNASDVVVFEDTEAGVASAKAAGMRCFAVLGTLRADRLAAADEIVPAIDVELMQRLLG
ncbi:MAG: HAD family phosphatase [Actinobacteria bacterium]|nr:MAG: HAD family phosphatase [Actinomycetota bacterium]TML89717.1 MAG: HAD family phosphatase [Actinomycetota bacterium]